MQTYVFTVSCKKIPRRKFYEVIFPYDKSFIGSIKLLPDNERKWNSARNSWEISILSLYELIKKYKGSDQIKFDFGNDEQKNEFKSLVLDLLDKKKKEEEYLIYHEQQKNIWVEYKDEIEKTHIDYINKIKSYLNDGINPYPHQIMACLFMSKVKNVLLAHDMGTGKTISSILYCEYNDYEKNVVITPNSLKFNYFNEVEKFTKSKAHIVNWKKNKYCIEESKYIIVNYDYFNPSNYDKFKDKWNKLNIGTINCVICDECQKLKNTCNTFNNFKKTFKENIFKDNIVSKIFMSGTPAPNKATELYNILNQISAIDFPTKKHFYEYYCGMTYDFQNGYGWIVDENSEKRFEELFHKISPFVHRKRKIDVLKDLPDKIYQKVVFELDNNEQKTYEDIENSVVNDYIKDPETNPLTIMLRLRQYTSICKIKYIDDIIESVIDTGEKIVIVDYFKESLISLHNKYKDISVLHTGDFTVEERNEMVKSFQDKDSKIKLFFGSIQTCNYGLTLTAANNLIILSLPYSCGEYDQVSDRLHRIGQKNSVNINSLIFKDTIDEYVYNSIEVKRAEISKVIDNEEYESNINESVLSDVINKILTKHGKRV